MKKKELSQLYYLNKEIKQQKQRLKELEAAATGCTAQITGMPHGTAIGDKVSKYAAEIADLKNLIELNIQKCWYEMNRLNRYIDSVEDSQMRQILTLRYIKQYSWYKIANEIGGNNTADSIRMMHNRFLKAS